ncbi:hypothetical protein [Roseobacter sp. HKCCA2468]|uniref:hypothetical protein n=1 Tax=Roseobacter sp. HKCCA2468 TaxID=3120342 RepID=UPI0030EC6DC9
METAQTAGGYLIREEVGGAAVLSPASSGVRIPVRPGAVYQILSSLSLENVSIISATKSGQDLVVNLENGGQLVFAGYFDDPRPDSPNAQAEFDQNLPLQLSALDYQLEPSPVIAPPQQPITIGAQPAPNYPVMWPQQGYFPPPPYAYEDDDGWGDNILALGGLVLGGLALAMAGLSDDGGSPIVNNNNAGGGGGGGSGGGSSGGGADPDPASVRGVKVTRDDDYFTTGETISIQVTFDDKVTSSNAAALTFEFNDGDYVAEYKGGVGTNTLTFDLVLNDAIALETELKIGDAPLKLNGATLVDDTNALDVTLAPFPALAGQLFVEPQPKITEITAVPDNGEFFDDLDAGTVITFFVKFDHAVSYAGDNLNLVLNTGDAGASFKDQIGPDGQEDAKILRFEYTLADGIDANSDNRELIPFAFNENDGDKVLSANGSDALVQIEDDVQDTFANVHEIKYDLDQPEIVSFALVADSLVTDGTVIQRPTDGLGGVDRNLLKVSGVVEVVYSEAVATEDGPPTLAIDGLYLDQGADAIMAEVQYDEDLTRPNVDSPPLNGSQKYKFTDLYVVLDDLNAPSDVSLTAIGGINLNMGRVVGEVGVPASGQLPDNPSVGAVEITKVADGYQVSVGAGPFIEASVAIKFEEFGDGLEFTDGDSAHQFQIAAAEDINGAAVNYLDEFTGLYKDLSFGGQGGEPVLRALIVDGELTSDVFLTPLSELHVRAVEASGDVSATSINDKKSLISQFFGASDFVNTEASFINQTDDGGDLVAPADAETAVALAALSTMDAVSGSLWATLDILTPIFAGTATEDQLASAEVLLTAAADITASATGVGYDAYLDQIDALFGQLQEHLRAVEPSSDELVLYSDALELDGTEVTYSLDGIDLSSLNTSTGSDATAPSRDEVDNSHELQVPEVHYSIEYKEWEIE